MKESWMLNPDINAQQYIDIATRAAAKAVELGINDPDENGTRGTPKNAADSLGKITVNMIVKNTDQNGNTMKQEVEREVDLHVVHAVDPVLINESGTEVILINRMFDPGAGLAALPGGFIDPPGTEHGRTVARNIATNPGIQKMNPGQDALRELFEETGAELNPGQARIEMVGERKFYRPFDIRIAQNESLSQYGIKKGDVFTVSTQAALIVIPDEDLNKLTLVAADDASPGSARRVPVEQLNSIQFGVKDHPDLINEAVSHHLSLQRQRQTTIMEADEINNSSKRASEVEDNSTKRYKPMDLNYSSGESHTTPNNSNRPSSRSR